MNQDRTQSHFSSRRTRTASVVTAATQTAADGTPSGQVHASVTEAFIRLVTLLDRPAAGPARFDVMVRDRVTGRTHALPVTEDMAVALLDASCATVSEVRPVAEHSRTADTAPAARRLSVVPGGATR